LHKSLARLARLQRGKQPMLRWLNYSHPDFMHSPNLGSGNETRDFAQLPSMGSASTSKMHLTKTTTPTKMTAPRSIEVGFSSSFIHGDKPQSKAVFFCPSFLELCSFASFKFIMAVLFGQPLRLVAPCSDSANSFSTVTRFLAGLRDGFTHFIHGNHQ
jgi:hypothetical protein